MLVTYSSTSIENIILFVCLAKYKYALRNVNKKYAEIL